MTHTKLQIDTRINQIKNLLFIKKLFFVRYKLIPKK